VLNAKWPVFNFEKRIWTIPAERMKARKEHVVPLSNSAMALLERQHDYTGGRPVDYGHGIIGAIILLFMAGAMYLADRLERRRR